eukprot:2695434-Amphidinium_carterae.1
MPTQSPDEEAQRSMSSSMCSMCSIPTTMPFFRGQCLSLLLQKCKNQHIILTNHPLAAAALHQFHWKNASFQDSM